MDGQHLNKKKIEASMQQWRNTIISGTWEANYVYLDEIDSLKKIKRNDWINTAFFILDLMKQTEPIDSSLMLFLHINIEFSSEKLHLDNLSLDWLKDNISEFSPPSFHYTSFEYFDEFYTKELIRCYPDINILELTLSSSELSFFYRTYFDEMEDMYSREIYVFVKK